jgi:hypothetical protein
VELNIHYRADGGPQIVSIPSQINPYYSIKTKYLVVQLELWKADTKNLRVHENITVGFLDNVK